MPPAPFESLPDIGFGCLLVDPPWTFKAYSNKGLKKSAQMHYSCMTLDDIKALPVASLAAKDCAMIMWTTAPCFPQALEVLAAWGFVYKTQGVWAKRTKRNRGLAFGTGHIFRGAHEPFIVATRGHPKVRSKSVRSVIEAPLREHSRKPDEIYAVCESLYGGPFCELFSRYKRSGWAQWRGDGGSLIDCGPRGLGIQCVG